MKKTYIAPVMSINIINACEMICQSLSMGGNASANGITEADAKGRFTDEDFNFANEATGWKDGLW